VLKQCLLASTLGLVAFSAVAQNAAGNQKCAPCECVPNAARVPCAQGHAWWYRNGHFDAAKQAKELIKPLKLTADQQSQVLDGLKSAKSQLETARSDNSLSKRDRKCKMALIREASDDEIRVFLDNKQRKKLDRIQNAHPCDFGPVNWP
jgi:hypothetical protein